MCRAKRLLELPNLNLIEAVCWIINLFPREHRAHWTSQCWEPRDTQREGEGEKQAKMEGIQRVVLRQPTPPSHEPCQSATHYTTQSGHDVIRHTITLVTSLRACVCVQKGMKKSTFQKLNTNSRVWKRAKPKKKRGRNQSISWRKKSTMRRWLQFFVIIVVVGLQSQI